MNKPFFSIVIATYNYGRFLEDAIKSVLNQSCQDYELIIVDGASKDNTLDIIKKYENRLSWWVSEPDKGQSDAFNKGFSHASGQYFTWLNADDVYLPGTLQSVKDKLMKNPDARWATGNFIRFRESDKKIIEAQWGPHFLPGFLQTFDSPLVIFGPTTFWSREVWNKVGKLDEQLHYSMDTDYWVRIMKAGYKQVRVNCDCWAFRMHEESKTAEYDDHKVDDSLRQKMESEKKLLNEKSGYQMSKTKRILGIIMRIVDFSVIVAIYRRLFVVGKKIKN